MRCAGRQPATYWVRILGVLSLLCVMYLEFGTSDRTGPQFGGRLFGLLHGTLLLAIWMLVPLLSADCISKERREGTLPLLFLTPLKPRDIVYAKGTAHGLRSLTLWLAVLPVLTVPLLLGGVGPSEILMSALVNCASICLAMAAGILASALSRVWARALVLAVGLASGFALVMLVILPLVVTSTGGLNFRRFYGYYDSPFATGLMLVANPQGIWQQWLSSFRVTGWMVLQGYVIFAGFAFLVLLAVVRFGAWCVKRAWREAPPSARVQWLEQKLTRPIFFQPWLKRWLGWQLRHNPIGWLEQRSWSSRLVVWSWFAVVVCIYSSLFANLYVWQRAFHWMQTLLASLLAGSIALSAAGSFRRERETGVLELLLIAPMDEWRIIMGRVRGLWMQFLPSIVLLCVVWLYCATFLAQHSETSEVLSVGFYCVAFVSLPVIGLYYSLAMNNYVSSLLWTLLAGIAVPAVLGQLIVLGLEAEKSPFLNVLSPAVVQSAIACLLARRLHHNLKLRKFRLSQ